MGVSVIADRQIVMQETRFFMPDPPPPLFTDVRRGLILHAYYWAKVAYLPGPAISEGRHRMDPMVCCEVFRGSRLSHPAITCWL